MDEFDLTLTVSSEKVLVWKQQRTQCSGDVKWDDPLLRATIKIFVDWLNRSKVDRRVELEVLGEHLYNILFNGEVRGYFERQLEDARRAGQRLIVRLSFDEEEAGELADLPWEYLYCKSKEYFLSTTIDLVLSRYVSLEADNKSQELEKSPLRILLVISNPQDKQLPAVGADQIVQTIQGLAESQELAESYPINIDILDEPTINKFLDKLNSTRPHVLHFIGHGHYNNTTGEAEIALLDEDEMGVVWVRDREFADYFRQIRSIPHLVLLHLCESASAVNDATFTANFVHLAPQLMRVGIPAVLAMQYPITNRAANAFCRAFYRALARGETIDSAVQDGRYRITLSIPKAYDNRVFGTPVLYVRSFGGIIQPVEGKTGQTSGAAFANEPAKPTQDGSSRSTATPQIEQIAGQPVESKQIKPTVNINPVTTDSSTIPIVEQIALAARKRIREMSDLTQYQRVLLYDGLSAMREELMGRRSDDIIDILFTRRDSIDSSDPFRIVIQAMIDALREVA